MIDQVRVEISNLQRECHRVVQKVSHLSKTKEILDSNKVETTFRLINEIKELAQTTDALKSKLEKYKKKVCEAERNYAKLRPSSRNHQVEQRITNKKQGFYVN